MKFFNAITSKVFNRESETGLVNFFRVEYAADYNRMRENGVPITDQLIKDIIGK